MSWTGISETIGSGILRGRAHSVEVRWTPSNHGRPFRAYCTCGWVSSMHTSREAAQALGDDHLARSGDQPG